MGETPGSEGSLDGWTDPPREWLNVRGIPNTVEKASWEGGREALEWPSAHVAAGTMGWVFLSALRAETEAAFQDVEKLLSCKDERMPGEPGIVPWKNCELWNSNADRHLLAQRTSPSWSWGKMTSTTATPKGLPSNDTEDEIPTAHGAWGNLCGPRANGGTHHL